MRTRRGFSYVEMLVVLTVIGVLTRIAIPKFWEVRKRAQSRAIIADVRVIRDAVLLYHQDRGAFPSEAAAGSVPVGLTAYLPSGFAFTRNDYSLDYELWPGGAPGDSSVVGVGVATADAALENQVRRLGMSGIPYFISSGRTVFVFSGLGGIS